LRSGLGRFYQKWSVKQLVLNALKEHWEEASQPFLAYHNKLQEHIGKFENYIDITDKLDESGHQFENLASIQKEMLEIIDPQWHEQLFQVLDTIDDRERSLDTAIQELEDLVAKQENSDKKRILVQEIEHANFSRNKMTQDAFKVHTFAITIEPLDVGERATYLKMIGDGIEKYDKLIRQVNGAITFLQGQGGARHFFATCRPLPTGAMELGPYNSGNELLVWRFIARIVGIRFIASVDRGQLRAKN